MDGSDPSLSVRSHLRRTQAAMPPPGTVATAPNQIPPPTERSALRQPILCRQVATVCHVADRGKRRTVQNDSIKGENHERSKNVGGWGSVGDLSGSVQRGGCKTLVAAPHSRLAPDPCFASDYRVPPALPAPCGLSAGRRASAGGCPTGGRRQSAGLRPGERPDCESGYDGGCAELHPERTAIRTPARHYGASGHGIGHPI